jgi:hypothetical protein
MRLLAQNLFGAMVLSIALASNAVAAEATISADIDKTRGSLDDQFVYTLTITGSPKSEPKLPPIDGLEIQPAGTSTSVQIINGSMSKSQEHRFVISPLRAGNFTIPAISVQFDGGEQSTLPIQLVVNSTGGEANSASPKKNEIGWLEREFSTTTPFVGQVVMVTTRFFTRARVMQYGLNPQVPTSVKRIPIEGEKSYDRVIDGVRYQVVEVSEALIPLAPGKIEFSPSEFQAKIRVPNTGGRGRGGSPLDNFFDDPFFGGGRAQVKSFKSPPQAITVEALPIANRPAIFQGWVGDFTLKATLSSNAVKVGETLTLSVSVEGNGTLEGAADYVVSTINGAKIYPDKAEKNQSIDRENGIYSRATFKFAIVPTQAGTVVIPPVEIAVFNPSLKQYQILKQEFEPVAVNSEGVGSAANEVANAKTQSDVQQLADDLLPWKSIAEIRPYRPQPIDWRICLVMVLGSALVTGASAGWRWRYRYLKRNDPAARRQRALKDFTQQLASVTESSADGHALLLKSAVRYFQAKFGVQSAGMTTDEILALLAQRSIGAADMAEIKGILRVLEAATYGSVGNDFAKVRKQLLDWIGRMDSQC